MATHLPNSIEKQKSDTSTGAQTRNLLIVLVAIGLSIAVFFGLQTQTKTVSLNRLAEASTPLEVALSNQKPTLIEFYATWCTSCQAMAQDMSELKQQYSDRLNVVMLNVDNTKWLPEVLHFRVDGIPYFVFLNSSGDAIASAIGQQPRSVLAANLAALAANEALPYQSAAGRVSAFQRSVTPQSDDPRGHGSPDSEG